jgi:hypothetical protein
VNKLTKYRRKIARKTGHSLIYIKTDAKKCYDYIDYYYKCRVCNSIFIFYKIKEGNITVSNLFSMKLVPITSSLFLKNTMSCNEVIIKSIIE